MKVIFSTHMTQARRRPRPKPPPPRRRWLSPASDRDLFRFDVLRLLHRLVLLRQRRAAGPIKEQHPVGDDLRAIALLTVRGIPGAGALATLDIHPAALLQELTALLRQLTPGHHAEPFGLLASLTVWGG